MATLTTDEVYARYIRNLSIEERVRLIEQISRDISRDLALATEAAKRDWSELAGLFSYPACGEDAQQYISRLRREADEKREKQWDLNANP